MTWNRANFAIRGPSSFDPYAHHSWPLSSEGSLTCHTWWDTGLPFIMVITEDSWYSHLLPSVWQWSYHYLFLRLRSVMTGNWTPISCMWCERSTSTPFTVFALHHLRDNYFYDHLNYWQLILQITFPAFPLDNICIMCNKLSQNSPTCAAIDVYFQYLDNLLIT